MEFFGETEMDACAKEPKKESPIDKVLESLSIGITKLKTETLPKFESVLASVLTESEKSASPDTTRAAGQTPLEERLFLMNDAVQGILEYLTSLQNRIQL